MPSDVFSSSDSPTFIDYHCHYIELLAVVFCCRSTVYSGMATFGLPTLRHAIGSGPSLYLRGTQRRWAQVHDVRFLVTHREPDRVIEKYRDKLQQKAQE